MSQGKDSTLKPPGYQLMLEQTMPEGFIRRLYLRGAWSLSRETYGMHGMEMLWMLQRGPVAVEWLWMTDYYLHEGQRSREYKQRGLGQVNYHAPRAQYEGQKPSHEGCKLTGGVCYSDGSATQSEDFFQAMLAEPGALWKKLEEWLVRAEQRCQQEQQEERNFS